MSYDYVTRGDCSMKFCHLKKWGMKKLQETGALIYCCLPDKVSNFKISKREIEIIKLMAWGLTSKKIASKPGYTQRTVEAKKN